MRLLLFVSNTARQYPEGMKRISSRSGFGVVELLLAISVLVALALVGWLGYSKLMVKPASSTAASATTTSSTPATSADPYAGWKVYSNHDGGVMFKYPSTWSSEINQEIKYQDGSFGGISGTLSSPSGHKVTWVYNLIGGKDGPECTPPAGDVPFVKGDTCDSKQILSVEQIPSVKPTNSTLRNLFKDRLYITESKYQLGTSMGGNDSIAYYICLDPYYNDETDLFPKVGTQMGFELPCNYWSTGFNVEFSTNSQADLNSSDAQTAKLIMRSFGTI